MTEQTTLPEISEAPKFQLLTELEIQNYRKALIEHDGDEVAAGITPEIMRNIIYTCRMKANPMQETESEGLPKPARKSKSPSTNVTKSSGLDVNNLFG